MAEPAHTGRSQPKHGRTAQMQVDGSGVDIGPSLVEPARSWPRGARPEFARSRREQVSACAWAPGRRRAGTRNGRRRAEWPSEDARRPRSRGAAVSAIPRSWRMHTAALVSEARGTEAWGLRPYDATHALMNNTPRQGTRVGKENQSQESQTRVPTSIIEPPNNRSGPLDEPPDRHRGKNDNRADPPCETKPAKPRDEGGAYPDRLRTHFLARIRSRKGESSSALEPQRQSQGEIARDPLRRLATSHK